MNLDYRALSNAGLWWLGRLQTDADRARVVEGLADEAGIDESTPFVRSVLEVPGGETIDEEMVGGKLSCLLGKPWRDGTVPLVLKPMDLIARVCALGDHFFT